MRFIRPICRCPIHKSTAMTSPNAGHPGRGHRLDRQDAVIDYTLCDSPIFCAGEMTRIHADSKTFVYMKLKAAPELTANNFRQFRAADSDWAIRDYRLHFERRPHLLPGTLATSAAHTHGKRVSGRHRRPRLRAPVDLYSGAPNRVLVPGVVRWPSLTGAPGQCITPVYQARADEQLSTVQGVFVWLGSGE